MTKKYKNPPIIEALCEFQFIPSQPWDLTIPGLIYEKIQKEFPVKKTQVGIGIQLKPTDKGIEHKVQQAPPIMQYISKDGTLLVQNGPDLLTINKLKPYTSWEKFKPVVFKNLKVYEEVAKPKGFKRIGVRYINRIDLKETPSNLNEYLDFYPHYPKNLPQTSIKFISRVEIPMKDNIDIMAITIGSVVPPKEGAFSIILDFDYFLNKPEAVTKDTVKDWIEQAHLSIENAFEACIKDKTRKLFD